MAASTRYSSDDARLELLQGSPVAILGYGNQGHAHALNLRDRGVEILVGARPDGAGAAAAQAAGFETMSFGEAASRARIIAVLLPDPLHAPTFREQILPHWRKDAVVLFAHGFALSAGELELPAGRQALLVAPKGQGHKLREAFVNGGGLASLVAVEGGDEKAGLDLALAYAHGIGALELGAWKTSFREEAITDQFGEQAVLCGGVPALMMAAWETLVDAGYDEEVAWFECVYEVKLLVDLMHQHGIDGSRSFISSTAADGGLGAGPRIIGEASRGQLRALLEEIEDGRFARNFLADQRVGAKGLQAARKAEANHPLQAVAAGMRARLGIDPPPNTSPNISSNTSKDAPD